MNFKSVASFASTAAVTMLLSCSLNTSASAQTEPYFGDNLNPSSPYEDQQYGDPGFDQYGDPGFDQYGDPGFDQYGNPGFDQYGNPGFSSPPYQDRNFNNPSSPQSSVIRVRPGVRPIRIYTPAPGYRTPSNAQPDGRAPGSMTGHSDIGIGDVLNGLVKLAPLVPFAF